ncbi:MULTISPECIES: hypothetical protein, partial [Candidatus Cardinium]|uniref:hypothetical protein n=1 Tax=Candidatus Cardinium TaxID=273135 RepID=UPI001FAA6F7C
FPSISHGGERKRKKLRKVLVTTGKTESLLQPTSELFFYFSCNGHFLIATILQGAFLGPLLPH